MRNKESRKGFIKEAKKADHENQPAFEFNRQKNESI
jgi:hypothetical protein